QAQSLGTRPEGSAGKYVSVDGDRAPRTKSRGDRRLACPYPAGTPDRQHDEALFESGLWRGLARRATLLRCCFFSGLGGRSCNGTLGWAFILASRGRQREVSPCCLCLGFGRELRAGEVETADVVTLSVICMLAKGLA